VAPQRPAQTHGRLHVENAARLGPGRTPGRQADARHGTATGGVQMIGAAVPAGTVDIAVGGQTVRMDVPPPAVAAAIRRLKAGVLCGLPPDPGDIVLIDRWADEQERKYPTTGDAA
jgi:hypothetical protein